MERQYRNHLSGYLHWDQLVHAEDWLLFEKNIGAYICIDEVALSRGELYTVLTNKEAHGGKGSMIAIIKGTDVHTVTSVLLKLSRRRRYQVREITLDMAPNMEQIARICFPAAKRVTDRFHVQKLAYEAVQEMRVKARWEALDEESTQIAYAKACGKMYHAPVFANGDTRKQLLARSIYLLYKKESLWTQSQRIRAEILFKEYPDIKKGYYLSMRLGLIYHQCKFKDIALTRLARWYDEVDKSGFLTFGRVARSIQTHYGSPDKSGGKFFNSIENLHLCTMNNQGLLALAQLILPSEILSNFEVVRVEEEASLIRIYLDESVKAEYKESPEIESKGFCEAVTIRDFPIRDKGVDLIVRRRKWYDKQNNRYFSDFYDLKAEETRYSKEFAAFLKGVYGDDSYDLPFA